jgi:hypothetical protein
LNLGLARIVSPLTTTVHWSTAKSSMRFHYCSISLAPHAPRGQNMFHISLA